MENSSYRKDRKNLFCLFVIILSSVIIPFCSYGVYSRNELLRRAKTGDLFNSLIYLSLETTEESIIGNYFILGKLRTMGCRRMRESFLDPFKSFLTEQINKTIY